MYWLSSARPDGRPSITPLLGVWLDGAVSFCTGSAERTARNLAQNLCCAPTTGRNTLDGLDLVVEGEPALSDETAFRNVTDAFESEHGSHFTPDGT